MHIAHNWCYGPIKRWKHLAREGYSNGGSCFVSTYWASRDRTSWWSIPAGASHPLRRRCDFIIRGSFKEVASFRQHPIMYQLIGKKIMLLLRVLILIHGSATQIKPKKKKVGRIRGKLHRKWHVSLEYNPVLWLWSPIFLASTSCCCCGQARSVAWTVWRNRLKRMGKKVKPDRKKMKYTTSRTFSATSSDDLW